MRKMEEIVKLKGAVAAGMADEEGNLLRLEGDIGGAQAQWLANIAMANNSLTEAEFYAWSLARGEGFEEIVGWIIVGPFYTVVVKNCYGVILKNSEADFNEVIKFL